MESGFHYAHSARLMQSTWTRIRQSLYYSDGRRGVYSAVGLPGFYRTADRTRLLTQGSTHFRGRAPAGLSLARLRSADWVIDFVAKMHPRHAMQTFAVDCLVSKPALRFRSKWTAAFFQKR